MSTIHLVYAPENADLAEKITQDLGRTGIPFQHFTPGPDDLAGQLTTRVQASDGPVLFLLTDNYLKQRNCMANALAMFQTLTRQNRILTVVADGREPTGDGQGFVLVPTQFDRVVYAIRYMNYWQTAYLDMNDRLAGIAPGEKEQFERDLEVVHMIANEIGELFSALRDAGYATWESFAARDYALFFEHFRLQEWYEQYRKLAALDQEAPPPLHHGQAQETTPVAAAPIVPTLLVPAPALEGSSPFWNPKRRYSTGWTRCWKKCPPPANR
ncbi:MAG: toll/interleukin-1 receptor domain-containing protein [Saprospirales bacterium]|nr:toll/interleukin-1 receptor domain-containing protein [Saprospirales bacterium]